MAAIVSIDMSLQVCTEFLYGDIFPPSQRGLRNLDAPFNDICCRLLTPPVITTLNGPITVNSISGDIVLQGRRTGQTAAGFYEVAGDKE